jgi:hypothetical protein
VAIVESRPKSLNAGEDPVEVIDMLAAPTEARGVGLDWDGSLLRQMPESCNDDRQRFCRGPNPNLSMDRPPGIPGREDHATMRPVACEPARKAFVHVNGRAGGLCVASGVSRWLSTPPATFCLGCSPFKTA